MVDMDQRHQQSLSQRISKLPLGSAFGSGAYCDSCEVFCANALDEKYGKTTAQVMLRWNIQRGIIVLSKSVHKERMIQNLDVFDFDLTEEDMSAIAALDTIWSMRMKACRILNLFPLQ